MPEKTRRLTFQPQGRSVQVLKGASLLEAAAVAGLIIQTPCGGAGVCGKCRVRVLSHAPEPTAAERQAFAAEELAAGWRLACQTRASGGTVHVPAGSLFGGDLQIVSRSPAGGPVAVQPATRKLYVELPAPTLADPRPDLLRLEERTGPFQVDLDLLRQAPVQLRRLGYRGTAVLADRRLLDFEEGDTTARAFGVAVDIGTTTLAASLLSLGDGRELATAACLNPQVKSGDDVLARIQHAREAPGGLEELRRAVVREIAALIRALCRKARVETRFVYEAALAGNTAMQHLFCGADPSPLGALPFAPACARGGCFPARDLELPIHPRGRCYLFPVIGGFVGGDTVSGLLATRLDEQEGPGLLVDLGTNGEIVLARRGQILAASTAAGPAFEGARISCGMRGAPGAIEKVVFDSDARLSVIGNVAPLGLCGSGLIDLAAELLRVGILTPSGRLLPPEELPAGLPPALAARVRSEAPGRTAFFLSESGRPPRRALSLTQRDVRELQLGCGAIRAGIGILLRLAGLRASALETVYLAGGFGSFIRRKQAQRLGLIPPELDRHRIQCVGNASLAGARLALLSTERRRRAEELARRARHVELSLEPDFECAFTEALSFPNADGPAQG